MSTAWAERALSSFFGRMRCQMPLWSSSHEDAASEIEPVAVTGLEMEQPAVLEEAAEHAPYSNPVAQAGNPRPKRAHAAHEEVDPCAGLRGGVQLVDHLRVGEAVHLDLDPRLAAVARRVGDVADLVDQSATKRERRDEQLAELTRAPESGEVVEEIGDVGSDVLIRGEEAEVLVRLRRDVVVVPGAEMDVPPQASSFASHDKRRLAVDLNRWEAVDDVHAGLL